MELEGKGQIEGLWADLPAMHPAIPHQMSKRPGADQTFKYVLTCPVNR
jgi:hypothetical protein